MSYNRQNEENRNKESLTVNCVVNQSAEKIKELNVLSRIETHMRRTLNVHSAESSDEENCLDKPEENETAEKPLCVETTASASINGDTVGEKEYGKNSLREVKLPMFYISEEEQEAGKQDKNAGNSGYVSDNMMKLEIEEDGLTEIEPAEWSEVNLCDAARENTDKEILPLGPDAITDRLM